MKAPERLTRQIERRSQSENQSAPSGPTVMTAGRVDDPGIGNSVIAPVGETRPTRPAKPSRNHRMPSGPATMSPPPPFGVGMSKVVTVPVGVIRPIRLGTEAFPQSVNQTLPSGPEQTPA